MSRHSNMLPAVRNSHMRRAFVRARVSPAVPLRGFLAHTEYDPQNGCAVRTVMSLTPQTQKLGMVGSLEASIYLRRGGRKGRYGRGQRWNLSPTHALLSRSTSLARSQCSALGASLRTCAAPAGRWRQSPAPVPEPQPENTALVFSSHRSIRSANSDTGSACASGLSISSSVRRHHT